MTTRESEALASERSARATFLRADLYHLLAIGFLDPTRELAAGVAEGTFAEDVEAVVDEFIGELNLAGMRPEALRDAAARVAGTEPTADVEALYHELAVEYARLFIGPPTPAVSPYESVHVDSEPGAPALLMVSPSARAVLAAYREAGLDMATGLNEPPDHIATELEYVYYLCSQEASASEMGDEFAVQKWQTFLRSFEDEHLVDWGVDFARQVEEQARQPFYSALASLAGAFLALEKDLG